MGFCDREIKNDIKVNCANPPMEGFERKGWIMNFSDIDWDALAYDPSCSNLLTNLALKVGKNAHVIEVVDDEPFKGTNSSMQTGGIVKNFTKTLMFNFMDNGSKACQIVDEIKNSKSVVVLEKTWAGHEGDGKFVIYGLERGMKCINADENEESEGGWKITIAEEKGQKSGIVVLKTDINTTETMLNGLLAK